MAISAPKTQNTDRELAPKGRHQAVLVGIKDEGEHANTFKEGNPLEPKVSFVFEIAALNAKGEPHSFSLWKTNSRWFSQKTGKMSGLIEFLSHWLDVPAGELSPNLLDDLELLCGVNARVRLGHKPKQDGSGDRVEMTSIEPWEEEDGELLVPTREWGDSGFFPSKGTKEFWTQVKSGVPSTQKPLGGEMAPPKAEVPMITRGRIGEIRSAARGKLKNDTTALQEFIEEGFGKRLIDFTEKESDQLLEKLRSLPDPDGDDDSVFGDDDEGEADEATARAMLQPAETPAPATTRKPTSKAASEVGYTN